MFFPGAEVRQDRRRGHRPDYPQELLRALRRRPASCLGRGHEYQPGPPHHRRLPHRAGEALKHERRNKKIASKFGRYAEITYICSVENKSSVMVTNTVSRDSANSYWNIVKHLSPDVKKDLITLLSQSLKPSTAQTISAKKYYGIWGDDGVSDEDFIKELESMRSFNHGIVEL